MNKYTLLAAAAASSMIASAASAQVTSYTDKTAFLAAAGTTQTETFATASTGAFTGSGTNFSATFDGFSVTGDNFGNFVGISTPPQASPNFAVPSSFVGQNYLEWSNISGGLISLTITFNTATTAFGFDWFNTDFSDQYNIAVTGSGNFSGPPFNVASSSATSGFFGLISGTAFTTATITNNFNGGYISPEGMDNFITNGVGSVSGGNGSPGAVPEPATWAMMIAGMGLVGASLRRRSQANVRFAM